MGNSKYAIVFIWSVINEAILNFFFVYFLGILFDYTGCVRLWAEPHPRTARQRRILPIGAEGRSRFITLPFYPIY